MYKITYIKKYLQIHILFLIYKLYIHCKIIIIIIIYFLIHFLWTPTPLAPFPFPREPQKKQNKMKGNDGKAQACG